MGTRRLDSVLQMPSLGHAPEVTGGMASSIPNFGPGRPESALVPVSSPSPRLGCRTEGFGLARTGTRASECRRHLQTPNREARIDQWKDQKVAGKASGRWDVQKDPGWGFGREDPVDTAASGQAEVRHMAASDWLERQFGTVAAHRGAEWLAGNVGIQESQRKRRPELAQPAWSAPVEASAGSGAAGTIVVDPGPNRPDAEPRLMTELAVLRAVVSRR